MENSVSMVKVGFAPIKIEELVVNDLAQLDHGPDTLQVTQQTPISGQFFIGCGLWLGSRSRLQLHYLFFCYCSSICIQQFFSAEWYNTGSFCFRDDSSWNLDLNIWTGPSVSEKKSKPLSFKSTPWLSRMSLHESRCHSWLEELFLMGRLCAVPYVHGSVGLRIEEKINRIFFFCFGPIDGLTPLSERLLHYLFWTREYPLPFISYRTLSRRLPRILIQVCRRFNCSYAAIQQGQHLFRALQRARHAGFSSGLAR